MAIAHSGADGRVRGASWVGIVDFVHQLRDARGSHISGTANAIHSSARKMRVISLPLKRLNGGGCATQLLNELGPPLNAWPEKYVPANFRLGRRPSISREKPKPSQHSAVVPCNFVLHEIKRAIFRHCWLHHNPVPPSVLYCRRGRFWSPQIW